MIPNSLDKIVLSIIEPTNEAVIKLNKISHRQKYKSSDEITKEVLRVLYEYNSKIKNIMGNSQLPIDDLPLELIVDDLLWYCITRFNVKCSDKEIDKKYKVGRVSDYLFPYELQYRLGFIIIENRFHELYEQAYDKHGKVKDLEAEKMYKTYSTLLQQISKFPSLRKILYRQIGQLCIRYLYERGILKETPEGYIISTEHPKVQEVMKKFYRY